MSFKKAQSAMEFLMTYGWALLLVLIVVGSLVFFGILNPDRFLPSSADAGPGIEVVDSQVTEDAVTLLIRNNQGRTISDFQVNVTRCNNYAGALSSNTTILPGDTSTVTIYCPDAQDLGNTIQTDLDISYNTRTEGIELAHTRSGRLVDDVVEGLQTYDWNKSFDAEFLKRQMAYSAAFDSSNNVYIVGYGEDLVSGSSDRDWWLKKFSTSGVEDITNWNLSFDSGDEGYDYAYSVAIDSNDNVYVVGYGSNIISGSSNADWWIKKFYSNGTEDTANWNLTFDGSGNYDYARSVVIDSSNNVYVVGSSYQLVDGSSQYDWWLKKFDSSGTEDTSNWNLSLDGTGNNDAPYSATLDGSNNLYVVGYGWNLESGTSRNDWWIKKFDSSGTEDTTNWNLTFNGPDDDDYAYSVAVDGSNNVYVAGYGDNLVDGSSNSDWLLKKFNSSGGEDTTNWNLTFDGSSGDYATSIVIDGSGNIYVAGHGTNLIDGSSDRDWWIKKFDSSGNEDANWNLTYDGVGGSDFVNSMAIDNSNNIYVVGYADDLFSGFSNYDWWIKRFNSDGTEII